MERGASMKHTHLQTQYLRNFCTYPWATTTLKLAPF
jgi:hypothetical protein